ncbi:MAG: hypothetical protein PHP31_01035 [Lentimicrobiaceae bacterium]|nr:hypothetical protein [Lentimicrobiaceae bacterium]
MKTTLKTILLIAVLTFGVQYYLSAQSTTPPKPPTEATDGGKNGIVGGGAPIGSGLVVLLTLAGAYGGYKLYKNADEEEE